MKFISAACILFVHVTIARSAMEVTTPLGKIQGISVTAPTGKKAHAFLGVPYAEAPTGVNRFLPPIPKKPWHGVFLADTMPRTCFQLGFGNSTNGSIPWWIPRYPMSEDCLQLNIWVPELLTEKAAVMVWIHGGGFGIGSANIEKFDGTTLATEENVIVVGINYRLNIFGFLHLKDSDVKGNMGLLDQVQVLKWIQQNIEAFGGDKKKVTLFGVSAGGISGALLSVSSIESDLFHAAILQSGVPGTIEFLNSLKSNETISENGLNDLFDRLNCSGAINNQAIIDCLREIDAQELMGQLTFAEMLHFIPVTDGNLIQKDFKMLQNEKRFHNVSIMIGDTAQDGSGFLSAYNPTVCLPEKECLLSRSDFSMVVKRLSTHFGDIANNAIDFFYTDWQYPNDKEKTRDDAMKLYTDLFTTCPINSLADALAEAGRTVFQYQFSHVPSVNTDNTAKWYKAFHGSDVDFVFGHPLNPKNGFQTSEAELTKNIMRYIANFAKYKDPNGEKDAETGGSIYWPLYTTKEKDYIDWDSKISQKKALRVRQCAFWNTAFPEVLRIEQTLKNCQRL